MRRVLIVDDNKEVVRALSDMLEINDIMSDAIHNSNDFATLLSTTNFKGLSAIIMDYNLEDTRNGVALLVDADAKGALFKKEVFFYSGNIDYIKKEERDFLINKKIRVFSKTQMSSMVDDIVIKISQQRA